MADNMKSPVRHLAAPPGPPGDRLQINSQKSLADFRRLSFEEIDFSQLSDNELVLLVRNENPEFYQELFKRYQKKLFTYTYHLIGNKEETEDLLQNVFVKTFKNLEYFDIDRKFSSWIYRIAHNESVNFLKRKSKRQFISWEDVVSTKDKLITSSDEKLPEELWAHQEMTQEVRQALEKLPEKYKQVLTLRYFSEYSYEGIGQILGKPVNTVGTLINRAKKKLYEIIVENPA